MEKKSYTTPSMEVTDVAPVQLLTGSLINSGLGIGYGGVDGEGTGDPEARTFLDLISFTFE